MRRVGMGAEKERTIEETLEALRKENEALKKENEALRKENEK